MNRSGHIIILRPDLDIKKYEAADFIQKNFEHLDRLRKLLNFINPSNYRGTGREFFSSAPYFFDTDKGLLEHWETADLTTYDSLLARQLFAKLEETNTLKDTFDDLCFFTLADMQSVYDLIDDKEKYEIIQFIENEAIINPKTLGFDVGYLAADYSVIADTGIKPTWHPPDFDDMQDIIKHLKKLNEHCLFPTFQDAKDYRELYLTKTWGEKEMYDGQITTIQILTT
jgi:hypothetical protein